MARQPNPHRAAAQWIDEVMASKAMSRAELVERSGVSGWTIDRLREGAQKVYRSPQLGKVSRALGYPPPTLEMILAGDPPPPVNQPAATSDIAELVADARASLEDALAKLAAVEAAEAAAGAAAPAPRRRGVR